MAPVPPNPAPVVRYFVRLVGLMTALSGPAATAITLTSFLATIALDLSTGPVMSLTLPYTLIVCFAAWTLGERIGVVTAVATSLITVTVHYVQLRASMPQLGALGPVAVLSWLNRLGTACLMVLIVSGLRSTLEMERWRAATDALTGALNKGAFEQAMGRAVAAAQRRGHALVLAYMDLDGFKGVNDSYGHSAGDEVLRAFSEAAAATIRNTDLFARIGGDEFVALLTVPDCDAGDATAEMLHARLSRILFQTGMPVTCSMGAIVLHGCQVGREDDLIALADTLMYEVKRSGKNALRIGRGDLSEAAMRAAMPPRTTDDFQKLLAQIDRADPTYLTKAVA